MRKRYFPPKIVAFQSTPESKRQAPPRAVRRDDHARSQHVRPMAAAAPYQARLQYCTRQLNVVRHCYLRWVGPGNQEQTFSYYGDNGGMFLENEDRDGNFRLCSDGPNMTEAQWTQAKTEVEANNNGRPYNGLSNNCCSVLYDASEIIGGGKLFFGTTNAGIGTVWRTNIPLTLGISSFISTSQPSSNLSSGS